MRRTLRWAGPFLALAFVLPAVPAAEKDKPAGDKKEAAAKMIAAGEVTGRVVNVEATRKVLTVELTVVYQVPNVGAINNIANIKLQMAQAAQNRDINGMRNLQVQLLREQANMMQVKKESHNVDIEAGDEVQVRLKDPPVQFDEKGNVKKYTAKELKELKGDSKLPGYPGDFDSLKTDQIVQIKLAKMKETPKPRGKGEDKDSLTDNKPVATTIMILQDAPAK
jgi:hypothetical protein